MISSFIFHCLQLSDRDSAPPQIPLCILYVTILKMLCNYCIISVTLLYNICVYGIIMLVHRCELNQYRWYVLGTYMCTHQLLEDPVF